MGEVGLTCPHCHQANVVMAAPGVTVEWSCGNCGESFYTPIAADAAVTATVLADDVQPHPAAPAASDDAVAAVEVSVDGG